MTEPIPVTEEALAETPPAAAPNGRATPRPAERGISAGAARLLVDEEEDIAIAETVAKLRAFRWPILALGLALGAAGWYYTDTKRPTWQARTTLIMVIPETRQSGLQAALGLGAPQSTPLGLLEGVVRSRSGLEFIAKRTGVDRPHLERQIETFSDPGTNQLVIAATHQRKDVAVNMVKASVLALSTLNRDLGFSAATKQVGILRAAIAQRENELRRKQQAVVAFQRTLIAPIDPKDPKSAALPLQQLRQAQFELGSVKKSIEVARSQVAASARTLPEVPSNVPSVSAARARLTNLEYELRVLQIQLGPEAADVVAKRQQIAIARTALQTEISRYVRSVQSNVDPRLAEFEARRLVLEDEIARLRPIADAAPREAVEFSRLVEEAEGAGRIVQNLREEYERARTTAEVDKVRWSVLDPPFVDDAPNNKNYVRNTAVGVVGGFLLGSVWAVRRRRR